MKNIDNILKRMITDLIINAPFTPKLGLSDGKMGITIAMYHCGKVMQNKYYETFAEYMLDYIFEEIHGGITNTFSTGLSGIGWGIEYLVQNKFVEADTNEILEEIDTVVFQMDKKEPILTHYNDDFYGAGLYYLLRTNNGNTIVNQNEILQMITKDIDIVLSRYQNDVEKKSSNLIFSINYVIEELKKRNVFIIPNNNLLKSFISSNRIINNNNSFDLIENLFLNNMSIQNKIDLKKIIDENAIDNLGLQNGIAGWCWILLREKT